jgi:hypothetical protein
VAHRAPTPNTTHDRLLVFGVAAAVLGVVMVSQGVQLAQSAAHLVPRPHAALMPVERPLPTQDERLAATASPTDRVPPTPAARTAIRGATTLVAACPPHFVFDHDPRLVLAAMAVQGRCTPRQWLAAPNKRDVPQAVEPSIGGGDALRLDPSRDCAGWSPGGELNSAALPPGSTSSLWSASLQPPTDATPTAGVAHVGTSALGARLAAPTSPRDHAPATPATRIARSGATGLLGPCGPHFDLGHDLGEDLAAMAQHGRRVNRECPPGLSGTPAKLGVPESVLARAKGAVSVSPAEASPQAARLPTVPVG